MTAHLHAWQLQQDIPLGIADTSGFVEVWRCWVCLTCNVHTWSDGLIHRDAGPLTPLQWEEHANRQRGEALRPGQRRLIEGG